MNSGSVNWRWIREKNNPAREVTKEKDHGSEITLQTHPFQAMVPVTGVVASPASGHGTPFPWAGRFV